MVEITAAGVGSVISTGGLTLGSPKGVALDQSGDLFIADTTSNRIVEVTAGGSAAALSIAVSSGSSTLNTPIGLAVGVTGNLYIADSINNRIVTVAAGSTTGVVAPILGGVVLSSPTAVAVDRMGNVFIADTGHDRIAEIDTSSNGDVLYTGSVTLSGPLGVALDVFGTVYIADTGDSQGLVVDPSADADLVVSDPSYSLNKTAVGFGHVQLGSSTAVTLTLPFTTDFSGGLGAVAVLTAGQQSLDFTSGTDTTCNASTGASSSCSVEVTFLPTAPGLRNGAVVLYDTDMNPILTVPLYGWGDAPVAALSPNTGSVISTGSLILSNPYQVALDSAGNMYVGDYTGKNVTRIPAGGGNATLVALGTPGGSAVQNITGVAVDGAGNLFIGDHQNSRILVVTPGGVVSVLSITGLSPTLGFPTALALDAAGNLYIADFTNGRIVRVSTLVVAGSTSSGLGAVVGTGAFTFTGSTLTGMTVDAQGNVYAAARTENSSSIIKVTTAGVASELSFPGITPAISNPQGVAVDAMGNIYVVDTANNRIVRLTTAGVASALSISGLPAPSTLGALLFGVTLDPWGRLYIPDWTNNRIVLANVSGAVLAFPNTDVGAASSPKTATVANLGDLPLVFATVPSYTANFSENDGDENLCALSTSLLAGTLCDVSVEFTPQSAGSLSTGIVVTNNSLNVTSTTQNVAASGTGVVVADTTAVAVSTNPTAANIGQSLSVKATVTDTTTGHTATVPTGGVTFMDTVGSTSISLNGGSAVTLNGAGTAILAGVTLSGAGVHTITANYVGVTGSFAASSSVSTLTISKDAATVVGPVTQPVQVASGTAGSVPVSVTGPYSVVAVPTGSLTYSVLNSSNTSVASGTATLTAGETDSATTIPIANSLASGNYTVSLTYGGDSNYAAITTAVTVAVAVGPAAPTIVWTAPVGGITYGATLSGILNASAVSGSTSVAGTFTYTATLEGGSAVAVTAATVLGAGSYTITATFTPTDTTTYASTSATIALTVAKATPALALTSSAASVGVGSAVTFTATLTSSAGAASGSVSFYDGTTLLGTGTLAMGVATYTTTNLPVGALSITAVYGGDTNFSALTSAGLTESVLTAFTVTAPTTPVPVAPGGAAIIDLTIPPLGGAFDSIVTLSASGLPPGATATFNPPTVTPGSAGAPTVMTIQLATLAAGIPANHNRLPLAPFSLGVVLFGAVLGRKRIPKGLALVLALASLGVATLLLTGCGGGFANTPSTPAGNYTVTVTGTSGSFQASTTVTLVVE
ncbi:MAG: Ig-like domain repeat protein [Terriglobales bacterium]